MKIQYNYYDEMCKIRKAYAEKRRALEEKKTEEEKQKDIVLERFRIQGELLAEKRN